MSELADYTVEDLKETLEYLRLQQLKDVHPDYAQLSATDKVRVQIEERRRREVPKPPDVLGEVVRLQRERGQR